MVSDRIRRTVHEHEEWGERMRNVFIVIGMLEVESLILDRRDAAAALAALAPIRSASGPRCVAVTGARRALASLRGRWSAIVWR